MSRLVLVRNGSTFQPGHGDVVLRTPELGAWVRRGGPLRSMMAHAEAAIATPSLCHAGRPFALALIGRLCARGRVYIADDSGAARTIGITDLFRWARELSVEPFTKSALLDG